MKRSDNFQKFEKKPKGSAIKEKIKQEKKKAKKERAEAIEKHFAKKREERALQRGSGIAGKTFRNKDGNIKSAAPKKASTSYGPPGKKTKNTDRFKKSKEGVSGRGKFAPTKKEEPVKSRRDSFKGNREKVRQQSKPSPIKREVTEDSIKRPSSFKSKNENERPEVRRTPTKKDLPAKKIKASKSEKVVSKLGEVSTEKMPLNKYIAHSGVCARRDAAILVKEQKVTVNGEVVTDPGTKVSSTDEIKVSGKKITPSKNFVYILLNKPKDFITTLDDPQGRRTVLDLVRQATSERIYPVGRLDRNTSGVLLLTNDGELAQKLSHPKHQIKKVYEVKLDRNLTKGDMDKIAEGITLEDGVIAPDVIAYADSKDKSVIGIEIHSGRNRIVRRIFEHMKYDVRALDRVMYAGLTKKNVLRGNWRFLTEKEVRLLKFMNQSFVKPKAE